MYWRVDSADSAWCPQASTWATVDEWPMMDELRCQVSTVADAWPMMDELRYEVNRLGHHVGNGRRVSDDRWTSYGRGLVERVLPGSNLETSVVIWKCRFRQKEEYSFCFFIYLILYHFIP